MPIKASLYAGTITGAGCLMFGAALAQWQARPDLPLFLMLILGILVSSRKIQFPGLAGTVSGGFAFVLFAASLFDWQATVVMAALSALTQSLWAAKRAPTRFQVAFNAANIVVCASLAHRASAMLSPGNPIVRLAIAGLLLFLCNTFSVAAVLCLMERRALSGAWDQCRFWAAPYYLIGGLLVGALATAGSGALVPALLFLAAVLAAVSSYYRTMLAFLTTGTART